MRNNGCVLLRGVFSACIADALYQEYLAQFGAIAAWEKTTHTGDRAELAELPEASALWHKLDARADTCLGQKCKEYERCFITEMRRRDRKVLVQ